MGHNDTWKSRRERQQSPAPVWRRLSWVSLFLFLLVAACSTSPAPPSVTPTSSGSASPTTITAYHGHTSTVFAVAWSPDGARRFQRQ